jgi:hypothetical protein
VVPASPPVFGLAGFSWGKYERQNYGRFGNSQRRGLGCGCGFPDLDGDGWCDRLGYVALEWCQRVMRKRGAKFNRKVNPFAMYGAMRSVSQLDGIQQVDLGTDYWAAFASMKTLHAVEDHFHKLAGAANVALVLAEQGVMPEALEDFKAAQDALIAVWRRAEKTGRFGFTAAEMDAIKEALQLHDLQLQAATQEQALKAVTEVIRRKENGDLITWEETANAN